MITEPSPFLTDSVKAALCGAIVGALVGGLISLAVASLLKHFADRKEKREIDNKGRTLLKLLCMQYQDEDRYFDYDQNKREQVRVVQSLLANIDSIMDYVLAMQHTGLIMRFLQVRMALLALNSDRVIEISLHKKLAHEFDVLKILVNMYQQGPIFRVKSAIASLFKKIF